MTGRNKLHWSEVGLMLDDTMIEDEELQRKYMLEFRDTGTIHGVFIADETGKYDWDTGPKVNEIDWTGIDS